MKAVNHRTPDHEIESSPPAARTAMALRYQGREYALQDDENLIGSGPECRLRLDATSVEAVHAAVVRRHAGEWWLVDRSSSATVRVNGVPLAEAVLAEGQALRFGAVSLHLERRGECWKMVGYEREWQIEGELVVGRCGPASIDDPSVSRRHACLWIENDRVRVRDLGSSNGTWIGSGNDERRLGEARLSDGDVIEIEGVTLELVQSGRLLFELQLEGRSRPLARGIHRIGRAPECEIWLDDQAVSRHHAELAVDEEGVTLRDLGSSNGTLVDGLRVQDEKRLVDGMRIEVARHEMTLRVKEVAGAPEGTVLLEGLEVQEATRLLTSVPGPAESSSVEVGCANAGVDPAPDDPGRQARQLLGVEPDASPEEVERHYRERVAEFRLRLDNAPTPKLRSTYREKLAALDAARSLLLPDVVDDRSRLPSARPVPMRVVPSDPAGALPPLSSSAGPPNRGSARVVAGEETGEPQPTGIPRSSLWMAAAALLMAVFSTTSGIVFAGSHRQESELRERRDRLVAELERMTADTERAQEELERLEPAADPLLESADFKFCNLSEIDVQITWLAVAHLGPDGTFLRSWDSSEIGYQPFHVSGGGSWRGQVVRGERTLWDGEALFYALTVWDGAEEVLHGGSAYELGGDCFKLDLD